MHLYSVTSLIHLFIHPSICSLFCFLVYITLLEQFGEYCIGCEHRYAPKLSFRISYDLFLTVICKRCKQHLADKVKDVCQKADILSQSSSDEPEIDSKEGSEVPEVCYILPKKIFY